MTIDQAARDQVLDITQSFLVQAPAGSGKTSLLVQRFLCALANVESVPEEIIAITFTRKAAGEMRDRILNALQLGMQRNAPENPYELKLWQLARQVLQRDAQANWQLLQNPARLKIQTIDAFCTAITKQMPILSRFGAEPQVDLQPQALYALAVDQFLSTIDQDVPWQAELFNILRYLDNDRLKVRKLLCTLLSKREQWLPTLMHHLSTMDKRALLENGLSAAVNETLQLLQGVVPELLDYSLLPCRDPDTHAEWLQIARVLLTEQNQWRKQVTVKEGFPAPSSSKNKDEQQQLKARKQAMLEMLASLVDYEAFRLQLSVIKKLPPTNYDAHQWQIVDAITTILPVLAAHLTVVFRDQGKVDFAEIAMAAISALRSEHAPTDLAIGLEAKIHHILVDEFQDTSHLQFCLLEQITLHWQQNDGRTLFLVGDPMQSIYRFRQAEVGLFLRAKHRGINQIKLNFVQLKANFRSQAKIIHWLNATFNATFPAADNMQLGAISYMSAQAVKPGINSEPAVECWGLNKKQESIKIVEIIQHHRANDSNASIAILVRAKSNLIKLLPALRQAGIAYQAIEIESLQQRPTIQDLLALTKALLHLDDRIAWLAILRAPWCGLSLADLLIVSDPKQTIWSNLYDAQILSQLSEHVKIRLQHFKQILNQALLKVGRRCIDLLVKHTWQELGGRECLAHPQDLLEAEDYFNLLGSLDNSRELYNPSYLENQITQLYLRPQSINTQAVQVMTMHKAKGLEFDVVILPGLTHSVKSDEQQLLLLEQRDTIQQYLLLAPVKAAHAEDDPIYEYLAWCEKQRQEYESLRLLYVAMTRAKQKIYCLAQVKEDKPIAGGLLTNIWDAVADQFKIYEQEPAEFATVDNTRELKRLPDTWFSARAKAAQSTIDNVEPKPNITYKPWQQDWQRLAGIVMHRALWLIAQDGSELWTVERVNRQQAVWHQHLRQLAMPEKHLVQALQLIHTAVTSMLQDAMGNQILSKRHKETYSEWRLTRNVGTEFENLVLDRVFVDQNNILWLVDYKLIHSHAEINHALQLYTPQITRYTNLLKALRPELSIKSGLYFPLQANWQMVIEESRNAISRNLS